MKHKILSIILIIVPALILAGGDAHIEVPHLDGRIENLGIYWIIPFVGILLSIAVFPLVAAHFWHQHFGKISLFWALSLILPFLIKEGFEITLFIGIAASMFTAVFVSRTIFDGTMSRKKLDKLSI